MRLAAILDDGERASCGDAANRVHIGRLAVQVHGHDRPRSRGDGGVTGGGVDRQRIRLDVDDHRPGAGGDHRQTGIRGGHRRDDDLVAGADVEGAKRERDRIGAVADADRMGGAAGGGELRSRMPRLRARARTSRARRRGRWRRGRRRRSSAGVRSMKGMGARALTARRRATRPSRSGAGARGRTRSSA